HILENTGKVMGCCQIEFALDEGRENQNQATYLSNREADYEYLLDLVNTRLHSRYKNIDTQVRARIDKELDAIRQMDFVSYFLINYDSVQYAIKKGYPYIGRGSGANSVVAYVLGITNVDPIELDLYFERFINLYRS